MGLPSLAAIFWSACLILLATGAVTDFRSRRIPDEATIAIAAIGLAYSLLVRPGSVWLSLVLATAVFCGLAVLSHRRLIGGGDLKLITAVTLLVPPSQVGRLLIDIVLAGGALSCFYLAARLGLKMQASPVPSAVVRRSGPVAVAMTEERRRIAAGGPMPYALAIFGGVCVTAANEIASCSFALSCSS